jgi:putative methionine-R-sulfoxide reductase with GAF domain
MMNLELNKALHEVARLKEPSAMAIKALPLMVQYMGADSGSLLLLADGQVVHKVLANKESFTEVSDHKVQTVLTEGMASWVLKHRQGGLASDVELDERWISMGSPPVVASALVVPLLNRGQVLGLLSCHHGQRGFFREIHLARAAEAAQMLAPVFDAALMTESTMASLATLCKAANHPSTVLDWQGKVQVVNSSMAALDIVWEGAMLSQSLLPRELQIQTVRDCEWAGSRPLATLPYAAISVPFRGAGVWIQLLKSS